MFFHLRFNHHDRKQSAYTSIVIALEDKKYLNLNTYDY